MRLRPPPGAFCLVTLDEMEKIRIVGGKALEGTVRISGAKNASLPDVCASILTDQPVILSNVPEVRDIRTMGRVLSAMGVETDIKVGGVVELKAAKLTSVEATYDLVKTMRASVLVLGPVLAREGRARVSLPGGCAIGDRPIDLHLTALEKMGAEIKVEHGYVEATAKRLRGAEINLAGVKRLAIRNQPNGCRNRLSLPTENDAIGAHVGISGDGGMIECQQVLMPERDGVFQLLVTVTGYHHLDWGLQFHASVETATVPVMAKHAVDNELIADHSVRIGSNEMTHVFDNPVAAGHHVEGYGQCRLEAGRVKYSEGPDREVGDLRNGHAAGIGSYEGQRG